jgi:hypothetical protein
MTERKVNPLVRFFPYMVKIHFEAGDHDQAMVALL